MKAQDFLEYIEQNLERLFDIKYWEGAIEALYQVNAISQDEHRIWQIKAEKVRSAAYRNAMPKTQIAHHDMRTAMYPNKTLAGD